MSEWKEYKLGDVINFKRGYDLPNSQRTKGKYPIVSSSGITDFHSEFKHNGPGVITGRYGTIGKVFYINEPYWPLNTALYITDFKGNLPKFIFYFLHSIDFEKYSDKSTVPGVNRNHLHLEEVIIPTLPEQRAIASILTSLDDKIYLLQRQNATLEAMAETLFRQWFVEEAKEDWEDCILEDLCVQIASGGTPSTTIESYYNGNINWYSTKELQDNFLYESKSKITKEGLENSSAKLFLAGTVLIAIYAAPTVGRLGILVNTASFNQAACGLVANEELCCTEFIYLYLKNQRNELNAMASGSAQQNLNVSKIKTYPVFKVPKELMISFKEVIQPIFRKIRRNTSQIHTLTTLRDTLLPKLMSGEVRVKM